MPKRSGSEVCFDIDVLIRPPQILTSLREVRPEANTPDATLSAGERYGQEHPALTRRRFSAAFDVEGQLLEYVVVAEATDAQR